MLNFFTEGWNNGTNWLKNTYGFYPSYFSRDEGRKLMARTIHSYFPQKGQCQR